MQSELPNWFERAWDDGEELVVANQTFENDSITALVMLLKDWRSLAMSSLEACIELIEDKA